MKCPGKPRGQYYLSHQTVDTGHGVILDVRVTPGDVYDSVPYLKEIEHVYRAILPIQSVAADSAYDVHLATGCWMCWVSSFMSGFKQSMTAQAWN